MSDVPRLEASSERSRRDRIRRFVRIACLVVAAAALWPLVPTSGSALYITALSPFVAIASLLVTHALAAAAGLGLVVGIAAFVRHRLFCRWLCPMGMCMDVASGAGRRLGRRSARGPRLGQWIVFLTLGGALLGYPLLLWLDPLAIFAGLLDIVWWARRPAAWAGASVFFGVVALSVASPGVWCGRLCPLGAFQDLLMQARRSLGALVRRRTASEEPHISRPHLVRRTLFGVAAGAIVARTARSLGKVARPLRPPGARTESDFTGLCTRCGNCIRVCPSGIIERDLGQNGLAGLLTPTLRFEKDYCREDCVRCTRVCPSGALTPMQLEGKPKAHIGLPEVDLDLCLLGDDRECAACARWCPHGAIRYVFSEQEYTLCPQIDPNRCNGCGACEAACPTRPKKAIVIRSADQRKRPLSVGT